MMSNFNKHANGIAWNSSKSHTRAPCYRRNSLPLTFSLGSINPRVRINTWWAREGVCGQANQLQMSLFGDGFDLFIKKVGGVYVPMKQICVTSTDTLTGNSFPPEFSCSFLQMCECMHLCVWVVTFYFTVEAVSVLLRFLVGFLVFFLGTLTVVVYPRNCILLQVKTINGFILKPDVNAFLITKCENTNIFWVVKIVLQSQIHTTLISVQQHHFLPLFFPWY